jgi:hypothetical protein
MYKKKDLISLEDKRNEGFKNVYMVGIICYFLFSVSWTITIYLIAVVKS